MQFKMIIFCMMIVSILRIHGNGEMCDITLAEPYEIFPKLLN